MKQLPPLKGKTADLGMSITSFRIFLTLDLFTSKDLVIANKDEITLLMGQDGLMVHRKIKHQKDMALAL